MATINISAVIITFNEENNIDRCLSSLKGVVDEIIVVDSYSTDSTKEICERYNVKFIQNPFKGHIQQKNFAFTKASYEYVLSLDADEVLSKELQNSILKAKENLKADAYCFNRLTNYCGQWIYHCGWYPDKKIRLWSKNMGKWGGENPHDRIIMKSGASVKKLQGDLLHYSFNTISNHIKQIEKFSSIAADEGYAKNKKVIFSFHLIFYPFFTFLKTYFIQKGFLDGYYGFVISYMSGFYKFLKYAMLRDRYKRKIIGNEDLFL